jgi:hypothetical protein
LRSADEYGTISSERFPIIGADLAMGGASDVFARMEEDVH